LIRRKHFDYKFKVINTGSSGGLVAIRRGEADIAGVHLLDSETGEYNLPFLERYEVDEKAVLIRGYVREQGLILQKGNPNDIRGLKDLFNGEHSLINRNLGSGTRLLLDMLLSKLADEANIPFDRLVSRINGYGFEAKSHSAVAFSILQGKAEAGLGLKACADRYGLDFIPLVKESYDFLVQKTRLEKSSVKTFIDVLSSGQFRSELQLRTVGLHAIKDTGSIVHPKGFKL
jgi:putative molybdopterin biosynthesis protein